MPRAADQTRILESVLTAWRENGYQGATTRRVAALAGVSEMTLFRRFGDKGSLFRSALELEAQRFSAEALSYSGCLERDLQRIVDAYQRLLDRSGSIILDFLLEAPRNPELALTGQVPLAAMGQVATLVVRYQSEGRLRDGHPVAALLALLSPLVMSALLRRAQPALALTLDSKERVREFLHGWQVKSP